MIDTWVHTKLASRSLHAGKIFVFLPSADIFQNQFFRKFISVTQSDRQTVCIQIRLDIFSGLIWVLTVAKIISRRQNSPLEGKAMSYSKASNSPLSLATTGKS